MIVALEKWPRDGLPRNPGAWITTIARNKAIDRIRRRKNLDQKQPHLVELTRKPCNQTSMRWTASRTNASS